MRRETLDPQAKNIIRLKDKPCHPDATIITPVHEYKMQRDMNSTFFGKMKRADSLNDKMKLSASLTGSMFRVKHPNGSTLRLSSIDSNPEDQLIARAAATTCRPQSNQDSRVSSKFNESKNRPKSSNVYSVQNEKGRRYRMKQYNLVRKMLKNEKEANKKLEEEMKQLSSVLKSGRISAQHLNRQAN